MAQKNTEQTLTAVERLDRQMKTMRAAQRKFGKYTQEEVDRIFKAAFSPEAHP